MYRFSKFHASTKPHKWSQTVESMNISFGPDWQQHIHVADNEQNPIGSGCVAQVTVAFETVNTVTVQKVQLPFLWL
jgi:predicted unusual protein kinase regulating ubiquinone biosynthesis (AarF/ABC1/UbiB family)